MRLCIGIEPGETLSQAEDLKGALQAVCPASKIDIAAYLDDNGPITMTVTAPDPGRRPRTVSAAAYWMMLAATNGGWVIGTILFHHHGWIH